MTNSLLPGVPYAWQSAKNSELIAPYALAGRCLRETRVDLPFPSRESPEDLEGFLLISFVITIQMIFAKVPS